jgi:1-deoxy-D-xylulose-5-phosphate synthase
MAPRDEAMLVHMLRTAIAHDGPVALRYPRGAAVGVPLPGRPQEIRIGTGETLAKGERVALIGYGYGVQIALSAAARLRELGLNPTVCDARFAKPLDRELLHSLAASHELLVTVEENVLSGGFGSAVLEHLSDSGTLAAGPAVIRFGLPDRYVTHGKPALLHEEVGLTPERVAERVSAALARRESMRSA